jgi:hypothetical protein
MAKAGRAADSKIVKAKSKYFTVCTFSLFYFCPMGGRATKRGLNGTLSGGHYMGSGLGGAAHHQVIQTSEGRQVFLLSRRPSFFQTNTRCIR